ncbi:MAG: type II toxin-antitoxin system HicB family antitoxin [Deltaproteobacteria bacterium]|nr:type II toxin-antitoxin system HicB family antitoxin [Deltaproteobacteria bacterium]
MSEFYKIPLVLTPQPEGGYTVTSPDLPEMCTEGDTVDEALENVRDALKAVVETYEDLGRQLPASLRQDPHDAAIRFDYLIAAA